MIVLLFSKSCLVLYREKSSLVTMFVYTSSGIIQSTIPQTMTGMQLKKIVLNETKFISHAFKNHILLYNNQCIDVERSIGALVPHNSSIVLQVKGKGGGRDYKKPQLSTDILGKLKLVFSQ